MTELQGETKEQVKLAQSYMVQLGKKAVEMAGIDRETYYFANRKENDAEHSYHLTIASIELASQLYKNLDVGLVAQFAAVHDLVEVITGDIPSHTLTKKQREDKHKIEMAALPQLLAELPPYTSELVKRYEDQVEPEARFVCVVDKLLPAVVHTVATEANKDEFFRRYGAQSDEHLPQLSGARSRQLREDYPEFELVHLLRQLSSSIARKNLLQVGNGITSDHSLDE